MTWVRLESSFPTHPKALQVGGDAGWLHVCALCWSVEHLTDGAIPKAAVGQLSDRRNAKALAGRLVAAGVWDDDGDVYRIHDFLEYQESREQVLARRVERNAAKVKAGKAGAAARWQGHSNGHGTAIAEPMADGCQSVDRTMAPSPSPSPLRSKSSSSRTLVGAQPDDDDLESSLWQACVVLAGREADRRSDIANRSGWTRARARNLVTEHADAASRLPANATPAQVLAYLDGSRPTTPDQRERARDHGTSVATSSLADATDIADGYPDPVHRQAFLDAWHAAQEGTT